MRVTRSIVDPGRLRRIGLGVAGCSALVILVARALPPNTYSKDLQQEYLAARALRDGLDVFTPTSVLSSRYFPVATSNFPHPSPHPPVLDLLSVPFSYLPFPALVALWMVLNLALVCVIGGWLGLSPRARLALAAWPPLWWVLDIGQMELVILVLLMLGWRAAASGRDIRAGAWLGLATALKFYPALLLVPFLVRPRFRLLASAGLVVLLGQLGNLLVVGPAGFVRYYRDVLPAAASLYVRQGLNSSPYGALLRILGGATDASPLVAAPGLVLPLAIIVAGVGLAALAVLEPELAPVAALVILPNAWGYYAVLALPAIAGLLRRPALRRPALLAAAAASLVLPFENVLLLLIHIPISSIDEVKVAASVLAAVQPAGYVALIVLLLRSNPAWRELSVSRLARLASQLSAPWLPRPQPARPVVDG